MSAKNECIEVRIYDTDKKHTQAKYQNGISYRLLLCFLAENVTVRFI